LVDVDIDAGLRPGRPGWRGLYSRALAYGESCAGDDRVDHRGRIGRFIRHLEAELIAYATGGTRSANVAERLLISQAIQTRVQLDFLGARLLAGTMGESDRRLFCSLQNSLRLTLRELSAGGISKQGASAAPPSLVATLAGVAGKPVPQTGPRKGRRPGEGRQRVTSGHPSTKWKYAEGAPRPPPRPLINGKFQI
jgi:hypothetical protein